MKRTVTILDGVACIISVFLGFASVAMGDPIAPSYSWLFDEGGGATTAGQYGSQDGTLMNSPSWVADTPFEYEGNHALSFNGTADPPQHASLGNSVIPHGNDAWTDMTVSMWAKSAYVFNKAQGLIADYQVSSAGHGTKGNFMLRLWYTEAKIQGQVWANNDSEPYAVYTDATFLDNQWNHIVLVSANNGQDLTVYLNGVAFNSAGGKASYSDTSNDPAMVGNASSVFKYRLDGAIDELAIWNTALSSTDIAWLQTHSIATIPEPSTIIVLGIGLMCIRVISQRRDNENDERNMGQHGQ